MTKNSTLEVRVMTLLQRLLRATHLDLKFTVESHPRAVPELKVSFSGPDTGMLLLRNGELLHAIEHLGAKVCGLEPEQHELLEMDAEGFKARRDAELIAAADRAAEQVRATGKPFTFSPMSSHERRRLHLALAASGLQTLSTGTGSQRAVVLYPPERLEA